MERKLLKSRAWDLHAFHTHGLPEGRGRKVRNLGWLYTHKHLVERFELLSPPVMKPWRWYPRTPGGGAKNPRSLRGETGFILVAHLTGGGLYATQYASLDLCFEMLAASFTWRDLPISVEPDAAVLVHYRSNPLRLERFTDAARGANALLARPLRLIIEETEP